MPTAQDINLSQCALFNGAAGLEHCHGNSVSKKETESVHVYGGSDRIGGPLALDSGRGAQTQTQTPIRAPSASERVAWRCARVGDTPRLRLGLRSMPPQVYRNHAGQPLHAALLLATLSR